jgi:hypothetical protein
MKKSVSALAAIATIATAVPATMAFTAIPQSANAAVRVVVAPGGGYYWNGRHYRNRVWRGGRWYYTDPIIVVGPGPGPVVVGPGPAVGGYYYGGRRWHNRNWECHYNPHRGKVCKYRYW